MKDLILSVGALLAFLAYQNSLASNTTRAMVLRIVLSGLIGLFMGLQFADALITMIL